MKTKKLLGLGVLSVIAAVLVGCGSGAKSSQSSKKTEDLTIWSDELQPASTLSTWKKSPFHTGLAKATGITADWEFPTEGTDVAQAFNLMLSESKLPDIIQYGMADKAESYIKDGVIKDLTKLLPKKAPNFWKFVKAHPEYDKEIKTDSGKYYTFPFMRENVTGATTIGPVVRKDWLDEQHLSVPKTIAEWENVIRVFKREYGAKFAFKASQMNPGFGGAFGAYGAFGLDTYLDSNNQVQLAAAQPEWKAYMTWLHKLYKDGLIDPDVVTLDDAGLKTKVENDKVGVTIVSAGTITSYMEDAKASGSKANWVGAIYPNQANGQKSTAIYYNQIVNHRGFQIGGTTSGKTLDKALKWLDWAFTDEGNKYWNFGTEGVSYKMVNGQPTFTDKITKSSLGTIEALKTYTGNVDGGIGVQSQKDVDARMTPSALQAMKDWYNDNEEALKRVPSTQISYTADESKELASLSNTLSTYISENTMKFLTGERSLNQVDDFIKKLKDQGLAKYLKIRQAGEDRYLKR